MIQNFGGRKFWVNLTNCKRIANIFLSKIFSFKKLVIRIYAVSIYVSGVDGVVEVFKFKTTGKQPLPDPNGELSEKIPYPGISSANACIDKPLDLMSDGGSKQNSRSPYKI